MQFSGTVSIHAPREPMSARTKRKLGLILGSVGLVVVLGVGAIVTVNVIKGNNGDDKEKGGTLEYLTPNLQEVLFTLTFQHLGIFKLTPEKVESGSENIRRLKAEMYCEDIQFDYKSSWA